MCVSNADGLQHVASFERMEETDFCVQLSNYYVVNRARILMQKHIFSMWAESKDASKSEGFSMKGVSMQKL